MSDITPVKANIAVEAVRFRTAISEAILQTVGGSINFINNFQYDTKAFFLNGPYNIMAAPQLGVDGLYIVPVNCDVFYVAFFNEIAGSSGFTQLDVKRATSSGGAFSTIFTTKPFVDASQPNFTWNKTGDAATGSNQPPVLLTTPYSLNAGDALRCDTSSVMGGSPQNCGIILYMRPR